MYVYQRKCPTGLERTDRPGNPQPLYRPAEPQIPAIFASLVGFAHALVAHETLRSRFLSAIPSHLQVLPRVEFNWRTEAQTEAANKHDR
jgi:hypothetical protein